MKVIDSNFLQNAKLVEYFEESPTNFAVLTDYGAMEAYKGSTLQSIYKSMRTPCRFPHQIVVLKGTTAIAEIQPRPQGMQKEMIDEAQTLEFSSYCGLLSQAEDGERFLEGQILENGSVANKHMERIHQDAMGVSAAISEISEEYSVDDLRIIRKRDVYSSSIIERMLSHVYEITGLLFSEHPQNISMPNHSKLPYSFIFRYSLCIYLLAIEWIANGGTEGVKAAKMRNDMVDMNYVAYATYFDGLLSHDAKANGIYDDASFLVREVFCT